ncbi:MAG: hypothetical protein P8P99_14620 [Maricaulis sp.]|nr:hypothetical protein [Maricaulis sp.]
MIALPVFLALALSGLDASSENEALNCDIGPIEREYGGNPWNVFGCSDGASIVLVSTPESTAHPFYFIFSMADGSYRLTGEGNADQNATRATYDDLTALTVADILELIEATREGSISSPHASN